MLGSPELAIERFQQIICGEFNSIAQGAFARQVKQHFPYIEVVLIKALTLDAHFYSIYGSHKLALLGYGTNLADGKEGATQGSVRYASHGIRPQFERHLRCLIRAWGIDFFLD